MPTNVRPSQSYRRRDLHAEYGGQAQGGISTPRAHPFVMIFSGGSGEQYGYSDGWQESGAFYYTGEGQVGDMKMIRGNLAIDQHAQNGKDLHVFVESKRRSHVTYLGQFVSSGNHSKRAPDRTGADRNAIVFELIPIEVFLEDDQRPEQPEPAEDEFIKLQLLALEDSAKPRPAIARLTLVRYRSRNVRAFVLRRAAGVCEGCNQPAPFRTTAGEPYLEAHHIDRLSDGGPDHPERVAGLCANCHRRAHHADDHAAFNELLKRTIAGKMQA